MGSSSEDEEFPLEIDVGGREVDPAVCPICRVSTYSGDTIGCSSCPGWFHFPCVGVSKGDPEVENPDVPFYCPRCRKRPHPVSKNKRKRGRPRKTSSSNSSPSSRKRNQLVAAGGRSRGRPPRTVSATDRSPPIRLKISLGRGSAATSTSLPLSSPPARVNRDDEDDNNSSDEEEERWLRAVDEGEDVSGVVDPELRSIKDPALMTVRQKAMVSKGGGEDSPGMEEEGELMALQYGLKRKPDEETEEARRIKEIKSQKRKEVELERREQDKKRTMEKLLKKKETKLSSLAGPSSGKAVEKAATSSGPVVSYRSSAQETALSFPPGMKFPMSAATALEPRPRDICSVKGCLNLKKYSCSKTGKPLCSIECYKINMSTIKAF